MVMSVCSPELKVQVDIQRDSQTPVGMAQLEAVLHNESVCFPGLWLVCLPTAFSRHNGLSLLQHSLAYRITALWSQDEEDRPVAACCFMKCCMTSSKRATDFSSAFFPSFFSPQDAASLTIETQNTFNAR